MFKLLYNSNVFLFDDTLFSSLMVDKFTYAIDSNLYIIILFHLFLMMSHSCLRPIDNQAHYH